MVDFKKLCRACNNEKSNLLNFYSIDEEPTLGEMYTSVTLLELNELDGLPQHICYPCAKKLEAAFSFQKSCQKNETQLRKTYEKNLQHKATESLQKYENVEIQKIKLEKICNNESLPNKNVIKKYNLDSQLPSKDLLRDMPKSDNTTTSSVTLPLVEDIFTWDEDDTQKDLIEPPLKIQRLSTNTETDTITTTVRQQQIVCDQCDKKFYTNAALILHKKLHKKNKKEIIESEKSPLQQNRKVFQCKFCKKTFIDLIFLKNHIYKFHDKELIGHSKNPDGKVTKLITKNDNK